MTHSFPSLLPFQGVQTNKAMIATANLEKVKTLLSPCAIFPTKGGKWVGLADHLMIADSLELEQLFAGKPGVHFVQMELPTHHQQHQHGTPTGGRPTPRKNRNRQWESEGLHSLLLFVVIVVVAVGIIQTCLFLRKFRNLTKKGDKFDTIAKIQMIPENYKKCAILL